MRRAIRIFDIVLGILCMVVMGLVAIGTYYLPNDITVYDNNDIAFSSIYSYSDSKRTKSVEYQVAKPTKKTVRLLGIVPVKTVNVTSKPTKSLDVSGEVFGIKLYTDGVIVVGTQSIDLDGKKVNPAEDAGIEIGDIIISINGTNVYSSDTVQRILNDNNGKEYIIKIKRDDRYRTFSLVPVFSNREGCYKAGMWVRDSTAGIGTITYYDSDTGYFGALGHQINDVDTNEIMPLLQGEAVSANVTDIQRGTSGSTGSLICDFGDQVVGSLTQNTKNGIFGNFAGISDIAKSYPIASKQEVQKGSASMICTIDSSGTQAFDIEISHISYNGKNNEQNMVIKITDSRLIKATGGIVQGMSGSPIIQNGKIIGAVTHVIVNNPRKGYAIFVENMLEQCR